MVSLTLLTLPPELRLDIWTLVLYSQPKLHPCTEVDIPSSTTAEHNSNSRIEWTPWEGERETSVAAGPRKVNNLAKWKPWASRFESPEPPDLSLLLVCRTVSNEVQGVLEEAKRAGRVEYVMECRVPNRVTLCPKWSCVPVFTTDVDTLRFRMTLYHEDGGLAEEQNGEMRQFAEAGEVFFNLLQLLNRFLERGPDLRGMRRREIWVSRLVVDLQSPRQAGDGLGWMMEAAADGRPSVFDPEKTAELVGAALIIVGAEMGHLWSLAKQRVGRVVLAVDGVVVKIWDPTEPIEGAEGKFCAVM